MSDEARPTPLRRALEWPLRWPVRRRLAAVSAALTLVILLGFAAVVGRLVDTQLRDDFDDELRSAAGELAFEIQVSGGPGPSPSVRDPDLEEAVMAEQAAVRVVEADGDVWGATTNAPELGPPQPGIARIGSYQVATAPVATNTIGVPSLYVQYARSRSDLEATIDRLWLLLGGGALIGTAFAFLAGLAVASRAMRPISSLTAAAREIASTRDPSRRIPRPETSDEVAELARTLDEMLRSLDEARDEREQAMQRQREFVADASHELRTPLTSILANLELLQASLAGAGANDHEAVGSALRSSRRMSRLVSDLLLLARADAGRTGARSRCDLAEIAAGALAEVEPVAQDHRLSMRAGEPVPVEGNPDELHRMILNLLDNAVRHTPDGTSVELSVASENGSARLEVSDDGPGIPPGLEEQLFRRFARLAPHLEAEGRIGGPADRAAGDGAGLGLAIVRAVTASHGGVVEAGPSPQGGARFTVRLPTSG